MTKYKVYLVAVASTVIEVEAEDGDAAVEAAFEHSLPYAPYGCGFDLGDWGTASELWPRFNKPEDDYEEVTE
jgi:hypothetical protein